MKIIITVLPNMKYEGCKFNGSHLWNLPQLFLIRLNLFCLDFYIDDMTVIPMISLYIDGMTFIPMAQQEFYIILIL